MTGRIRTVNDRMLEDALSEEDSIAAVLFNRSGGPRSSPIEKILAGLAVEYEGLADFMKIDLEENPSVAEWARIRAVPSVVLYMEGKEAKRCTRPRSRRKVCTLLEAIFPNP